mmetsp:Transcript_2986/g.12215  ORF Transcript_2986/g.12215 Transcript_2986/m.12215 type:complete len:201 (-) Transcript_2986:5868-6470(-)
MSTRQVAPSGSWPVWLWTDHKERPASRSRPLPPASRGTGNTFAPSPATSWEGVLPLTSSIAQGGTSTTWTSDGSSECPSARAPAHEAFRAACDAGCSHSRRPGASSQVPPPQSTGQRNTSSASPRELPELLAGSTVSSDTEPGGAASAVRARPKRRWSASLSAAMATASSWAVADTALVPAAVVAATATCTTDAPGKPRT